MDLFQAFDDSQEFHAQQPLAEQMRPRELSEILGQVKILGPHSPWKKVLSSDQLPSLIFWGPPGCGKTTLARILVKKSRATEVSVNAVDTGAKQLREIGEDAKRRRLERREKTILFIDEIHRLNKGQQDVLLPFIEKGDLSLLGATTENPSYELNSALLSRCRVLVFQPLSQPELDQLLTRTLTQSHISTDLLLTPEAKQTLLGIADGDGRKLLNALEILIPLFKANAFTSTSESNSTSETISDSASGSFADLELNVPIAQADLPQAQSDSARSESELPPSPSDEFEFPLSHSQLLQCLETTTLNYDKSSDQHHDTISAYIKSVRGSDPDAAIYYLARMVKAGEDPVFIARRLVILASEDIGNADPRGLLMATAALQAVELIGWPEAAINLAQVTLYLACAPKSNRAYKALGAALELVEKTGSLPIPLSLRSSNTSLARSLGYGGGYQYSHDGAKGFIQQEFLPKEIAQQKFYDPAMIGFEKTILDYLAWLKKP